MANNKVGFDYYAVETNRYQDIRLKKLKLAFGTDGIALYDYILCEIYRVRGCYIVWDESTAFDVADYFKVKETLVNEIVAYCCVVGLFDKALLTRGKILSSAAIQKRFIDWSKKAKRLNVELPECCIIIPEEPPKLQEVDRDDSGSLPQSKGKVSKEKKPKVKELPREYALIFPESCDSIFFSVWEKLRRQPKWKNKTSDALQESLDFLGKFTVVDSIEMMRKSIAGNWQGVFELKNQKNGTNQKTGNGSITEAWQQSDRSGDTGERF